MSFEQPHTTGQIAPSARNLIMQRVYGDLVRNGTITAEEASEELTNNLDNLAVLDDDSLLAAQANSHALHEDLVENWIHDLDVDPNDVEAAYYELTEAFQSKGEDRADRLNAVRAQMKVIDDEAWDSALYNLEHNILSGRGAFTAANPDADLLANSEHDAEDLTRELFDPGSNPAYAKRLEEVTRVVDSIDRTVLMLPYVDPARAERLFRRIFDDPDAHPDTLNVAAKALVDLTLLEGEQVLPLWENLDETAELSRHARSAARFARKRAREEVSALLERGHRVPAAFNLTNAVALEFLSSDEDGSSRGDPV